MVNMPPLMQQNPTPFFQSLIPVNDALNHFIVTTKCFLIARRAHYNFFLIYAPDFQDSIRD